ncbi:MAG: hypothetical protein WC994_05450 [Brumimicrobium sp.]
MISYKRHTFYAITFFFIAATMGLLLRTAQVFPMGFNYRFVVHAHSHVALMGWIHLALMTLIVYHFLNTHIPKNKYLRIFWVTMISVIGMLISFPFQGYAVFSIIFSSLFLIISYFFAYVVFKYTPKEEKKKASFKTLKWALIFMIISSIGPWSVGGIMATLGPSSHWYRTSIYLYLHFQYNAWIILGVIAIIIKLIEKDGNTINSKMFNSFILYFNISSFLTMFISVLYTEPPYLYFLLAVIGSLLQLFSTYYLYKIIVEHLDWFKNKFLKLGRRLLIWAFILFVLKSMMQLTGSFPETAKIIAQNNYLAIGFLHLIFLGVVSLSILALFQKASWIKISNLAIQTFIMGFAFTEIIIFYRPAVKILGFPNSPNYDIFLFIASIFLVIGIAMILFRMIRIRIELK